jgi:hypothetical protein
MSAELGRPIGAQRGWEALGQLGFTPPRPRPGETRADPVQQETFKKGPGRGRRGGRSRPSGCVRDRLSAG